MLENSDIKSTDLGSVAEEGLEAAEGNEESPYSAKRAYSDEKKPSEVEDGVDNMVPSRLPAASLDSRWSDTSSYGAKKVIYFFLVLAIRLPVILFLLYLRFMWL